MTADLFISEPFDAARIKAWIEKTLAESKDRLNLTDAEKGILTDLLLNWFQEKSKQHKISGKGIKSNSFIGGFFNKHKEAQFLTILSGMGSPQILFTS